MISNNSCLFHTSYILSSCIRGLIKATDHRADGTLPLSGLFLPRVCLGMVLKDRIFVPDLENRNRLCRCSLIFGYRASIQNTYLGMRALARFYSRPTFLEVFYIYCLLREVFLSWAVSKLPTSAVLPSW